ncbi:MAG: aminotransferase [Gammaproteobacteria bacterium]|nr:aminotransferase [Gammaproteobacteria bacterium]
MSPPVNPDLADTGTPPIPAAQAWLAAYDGRFGPAINMSQAAPGNPPPQAMLDRLAEAARSPAAAQYGRILGDAALVDAFARDCSALYGADVGPDEIAVTAGCNMAYVAAMMAIARAGDSVLLPEPWYFNHEMTLRMLGVGVIPLPCRAERSFVPDPEEAERLLTPRTRALVLVSPNNPTGAIYPPHVLFAFAELAARRSLWLVLDETYRDFLTAEREAPHGLLRAPELRGHLVQLYSFSKAYCMPGHRIGAMIAPHAFLAEVAKVLDCVQISPPRVGQMALAWAIPALGAWREESRQTIMSRASAFRTALGRTNGWSISSLGAYFSYVRHPFDGRAGEEVAQRLASEAGVLALPGTYFGGPTQAGHLRFAFANADEAAIARIAERLDAIAL